MRCLICLKICLPYEAEARRRVSAHEMWAHTTSGHRMKQSHSLQWLTCGQRLLAHLAMRMVLAVRQAVLIACPDHIETVARRS